MSGRILPFRTRGQGGSRQRPPTERAAAADPDAAPTSDPDITPAPWSAPAPPVNALEVTTVRYLMTDRTVNRSIIRRMRGENWTIREASADRPLAAWTIADVRAFAARAFAGQYRVGAPANYIRLSGRTREALLVEVFSAYRWCSIRFIVNGWPPALVEEAVRRSSRILLHVSIIAAEKQLQGERA